MTTANKTIKINDVAAAKKLVSAAVRCPFDIDIVFKGKIFIDAKSILGVLSLGVEEPLELKYDGYDEDFVISDRRSGMLRLKKGIHRCR